MTKDGFINLYESRGYNFKGRETGVGDDGIDR